MHRIQHPWIRCSRFHSTEFLHLLTATAPMLRSFHLCLTTVIFLGQQITIDKNTSAGSAPCLRELRLERCRVDWSSPVFSGLTNMNPVNISIMTMSTMDTVIRATGQLPDLQQLFLEGSLPSVSARPIDSHGMAKIPLPKLENVSLTDSIFSIVAFLAHLEFPRSAMVHLRCICSAASDVTIIQPFVEERFDDSSRPSQIPRSSMPLIWSLDLDCEVEQDTWSVVCGILDPNIHRTNYLYSTDEYLDKNSTFASTRIYRTRVLAQGRTLREAHCPLSHSTPYALEAADGARGQTVGLFPCSSFNRGISWCSGTACY
ncbi:hypothetical protein BKA82DRAFT_996710 [Pisolithus tinctorius]|uniref:F-box domain-containing protein n=1 Tax=Pisolithus tinctorius Marx 270 TaxID=870435 RepID=A0A0C3KHC0_PISTI|nr:hypothetical protein BKA82DRAFT_996710 [Pisolithus tinctorius]KIO08992.1 hypothetical protein M404DRAFT_996710 [Pisolithus tinctorius Marx 270]